MCFSGWFKAPLTIVGDIYSRDLERVLETAIVNHEGTKHERFQGCSWCLRVPALAVQRRGLVVSFLEGGSRNGGTLC